MGKKLYMNSIRRFDRYFGNLVKKLNLDEVNLIFYCDHGMSYGRFINVPQGKEIERIVGKTCKHIFIPIYI